jgi:hypothetical protein
MGDVIHIKRTVQRLGHQLERMADKDISMATAFDILAKKAASIEEMVVVEVMREVYLEMQENGVHLLISRNQADSSTRSARTPAMALSR